MDELHSPLNRGADSATTQLDLLEPPPNEKKALERHLVGDAKVDVFAVWDENECESQNCPVRCACISLGQGLCESEFILPIIVTLVYFVLGMYFNCVMQVVAENRSTRFQDIPRKYNMTIEDTNAMNTLPDIGYDILPFVANKNLPDIWVFSIVGLGIVRFALTRLRLTILRRWTFLLGTIFFVRGASIILTMLPNPLHSCVSSVGKSSVFVDGFFVMVFTRVTCSDVLFSGHTVFLTLMALLFYDYSHIAPVCSFDPCSPLTCGVPLVSPQGNLLRFTSAKLIVCLFVIAGYFIIVATHFHYTVDVYLGSTLTIFIWRWYHEYIRELHVRKFIINDLFLFLERGAPDIKLIHERSRQQQALWEKELNKDHDSADITVL